MAEQLESRAAGVDVILTRRSDKFIDLNERAEVANRARADVFVSIHADSSPNTRAYGFTVYVARQASRNSLILARAIERRLRDTGVVSRGVRKANYRVLVRTACPAVLVELGYLSNVSEAAKLLQKDYRRNLASAISEGIVDYLQGR